MSRRLVTATLLAIALVVALGGPLASDEPDGLQRVALSEGFDRAERDHALEDAPLAGYEVEGVDDEGASTGLSGMAGVALAFVAATAVSGGLSRLRRRDGAGR